jgi:DNA-binding XRE family transcriptional regulator
MANAAGRLIMEKTAALAGEFEQPASYAVHVTHRLLSRRLLIPFQTFPMSVHNVKTVFGSAVKEQRCSLGLSQEELGNRAGLHRTYVSDVERGTRNISLESIDRLARALGLSVSALFARAEDEAALAERLK